MSDLMKNIDGRTKLAGTNKLEILLFTLGADARSGRRETYGINVFKVREVMRVPEITRPPELPPSVEGMVSLRGQLVPIVDLVKYAGVQTEVKPEVMIVTEYNGHTQGFLVEAVDTILRLDWSSIRVPPDMFSSHVGGLVTAVTELPDGRLVMLMDVEKVLAETTGGMDDEQVFSQVKPVTLPNRTIFFCDDSPIARKQIERTLQTMGCQLPFCDQRQECVGRFAKICSAGRDLQSPAHRFNSNDFNRCRNARNGRLYPNQECEKRSAL